MEISLWRNREKDGKTKGDRGQGRRGAKMEGHGGGKEERGEMKKGKRKGKKLKL